MVFISKKLLLPIVFILGFCYQSHATHVVSQNLQWEWMSKDSLRITRTQVIDCKSYDNIGTLYLNLNIVGNGLNKDISLKTQSASGLLPISYTCSSICNGCTSGCNSSYGFKKRVSVHYLYVEPYRKLNMCDVDIYTIFSDRQKGLTNGMSAEQLTVYFNINLCDTAYNSGKWSTNPINPYVCLGQEAQIDCSLLDIPDGLTAKYRLAEPINGINTNNTIIKGQYTSPFNYLKPLTFRGFPFNTKSLPLGFHLDSLTGILKFTGVKAENTVVAMVVELYDNDSNKLVSVNQREFQLYLTKCTTPTPPTISGVNCSDTEDKNFEYIACAGQNNCFDLCIDYHSNRDTLLLNRIGDTTFGAIQLVKNKGIIDSVKFCYNPSKTDTGKVKNLLLNLNNNECPIAASYSQLYKIKVVPFSTVDLKLGITKIDSCGNYIFTAKNKDKSPIHKITWFINDSLEIGEDTLVNYKFASNGKYLITAFHDGCTQQYFDTIITVSNLKSISMNQFVDTLLCANQDYTLKINANGGFGAFSYNWNIPKELTISQGNNKSQEIALSFPRTIDEKEYTYSYTAIDTFGCSLTKTTTINVKDFEEIDMQKDLKFCLKRDTVFALNLNNKLSGWFGEGIENDSFKSKLAPHKKITINYLDQTGRRCVVDTAIIENYNSPKLTLIDDFSICKGAQDTLLSAIPAGGIWKGASTYSNGLFKPFLANIGQHSISYEYTDSNACSSTAKVLIDVVNYKPTLSLEATDTSCLNGDFIQLKANPKGGKWTAKNFSSNKSDTSVNPIDFTAGIQYFKYSYTDSNSCENSDSVAVYLQAFPQVDFIVDSIVAQKAALNIENKTIEINNTNYTWIISKPSDKIANGFEPKIVMDSLGYHDITLIATDAITGCSDTLVSKKGVHVVLKTGLFVQNFEGLKVYPNPFKQELHFNNDGQTKLHYKIISQNGKVVYNQKSSSASFTINLAHLPKGVYILQISGSGITESQQIIKE